MNIITIIPARGGSKGIPDKNIRQLAGKPLIAWTIEESQRSTLIHSTYVSSDSEEILGIAERYGALPIKRPDDISDDNASSEAALLHALETLEKNPDLVVFPQVTSPVRVRFSFDRAISQIKKTQADSLLSVTPLHDFFIWCFKNKRLVGLNHDYKNRKRRQDIPETYLENGSFYIFKPEILYKNFNRLGGVIDKYLMSKIESHQIDHWEDFDICEYYLKKVLNGSER